MQHEAAVWARRNQLSCGLHGIAQCLAFAVLVTLPMAASAATVKIEYPANNRALILDQGSISVTGVLLLEPGESDRTFELLVSSGSVTNRYTVSAGPDGHWQKSLAIPRGKAFKLHATWRGGETRVIATVTQSFPGQPAQRVTLLWKSGVDAALTRIAQATLTAGAPVDFASKVHMRTEQLFKELLSSYPGVKVELPAASGPGLFRVFMTPTDDASLEFGRTSEQDSDCGNARADGSSLVFVGSFARSMVNDVLTWEPMARTDTPETRVEDVSQALAATAVHEFFHGMGLLTCDWMEGYSGHNDPGFLFEGIPGAERYQNGAELMDPGVSVPSYRRLGETDKTRGNRMPRALNGFNRSYLELLTRPPA